MWVQTFIDHLRFERNCSEKTVALYGAALEDFRQFFESLEGGLTWESVDGDVVREWVVRMMDRGNKASSVGCRLSAVRSFYKFLLRRGLVERDPAHAVGAPRKERPLPYYVREQEMDRLLDGGFFPDGYEGARDYTMILMFYSAGLRLSELVGLNLRDVDLAQRQLRVIGKRDKQRIVPFGEELGEAVAYYLMKRAELCRETGSEAGAFFLGHKLARRVNATTVRSVVEKYLSLVTTQRKKSPHVLRHTFATAMLNHRADLQSVKELLGHESLSTTEIYTHTTFEELKQMYNQAHPRAK